MLYLSRALNIRNSSKPNNILFIVVQNPQWNVYGQIGRAIQGYYI